MIGKLATLLATGLVAFATAALAQLPSLPLALVVTITAPAGGAVVGGTVPVQATVSGVGAGTVTAVQFRLDGANLGAEDSSSPYAISWNSTGATDGWHTLTAVGRDASGLLHFTSDPVSVRVANAPPPPPATTQRIEENDPAITYGPGWAVRNPDWFSWSGGHAMQASLPGATATVAFNGPSITWLGYRSGYSGIARVSVDGAFVAEVDLFARTDEARAPAITVNGLAAGAHTLTIEATGMKNAEAVSNVVLIDAFDLPAPVVLHRQDSDPAIVYDGAWTLGDPTKAWSGGGASHSAAGGARATFTFDGTAIAWRGDRRPDGGIARVFLDGTLAGEVNTYLASQQLQDVLFSATDLADATHTLVIEVTGARDPAASDAVVLVDAFDVTSPGTRTQETGAALAWQGPWTQGNRNRPWSEGTAAVGTGAGQSVQFPFTGTGVRWIGFRAGRTGIANVYLDGAFVAQVDTYAPSEGFQYPVFELRGLPRAAHTLTVEVTGNKHPLATNNYVVVDAFDVRP